MKQYPLKATTANERVSTVINLFKLVVTTFNNLDEKYDDSAKYFPDCGFKPTFENDAGTFCIKCTPNH